MEKRQRTQTLTANQWLRAEFSIIEFYRELFLEVMKSCSSSVSEFPAGVCFTFYEHKSTRDTKAEVLFHDLYNVKVVFYSFKKGDESGFEFLLTSVTQLLGLENDGSQQ